MKVSAGRIVPPFLFLALASATPSEGACGYLQIEIKGRIVESGGAPVEGALILAFVDDDPEAVVDLSSEEDSTQSGADGHFVLRGSFIDVAWPRWWHRFSRTIDHCGRRARTLTVVVHSPGHLSRRLILTADDGSFSKTSSGAYVAELTEPIRLVRRPSSEQAAGRPDS